MYGLACYGYRYAQQQYDVPVQWFLSGTKDERLNTFKCPVILWSCCCCCCYHINSHNQVRGHGTIPQVKNTNQRWYTHITKLKIHSSCEIEDFVEIHVLQLTQVMPPPETYKNWIEIGSQPTMCQVHTGAYVLPPGPGKTDYTDPLPPKKDYVPSIYERIAHINTRSSTYHYAYARQTQVNWKKETKKKKMKERVQYSYTKLTAPAGWRTSTYARTYE